MPSEQSVATRLDPEGVQVVAIVIDRGYHPAAITARAGHPLRLVFRRDDDDPCSERVIFSEPRLDRRLNATGLTIIDFPARRPGAIRFTCGMGRYRGTIKFVANASSADHSWWARRIDALNATLGKPLAPLLWTLLAVLLVGVLVFDPGTAIVAAGAALAAWAARSLLSFRRS